MNALLAAALAAGGFAGGFMAGCWYIWRQRELQRRQRRGGSANHYDR